MMHFFRLGTSLKICRARSVFALATIHKVISTSSLLFNGRPLKRCFSGPSNRVDNPGFPGETTAKTLVSHVRCAGLHCHAEGLHLEAVHLFGPLKKYLESRRFHNKEVEMVVRE
jgi:hypothetical protein